jgi:DNA-binding GntR family transcriptional regulator
VRTPEEVDAKVLGVLRPDRYMGRTSIAHQAALSMQAVAEALTRLCRVGLAERKAGTSAVVYRLVPAPGGAS